MMDSFLSNIFPNGLFGNSNHALKVDQPMTVVTAEGRKRPRDVEPGEDHGGSCTPTLVSVRRGSEVPSFREEDDDYLRPVKRFRGVSGRSLSPSAVLEIEEKKVHPSTPKLNLPEDVLAHCLSFLGSTEDRFALQCTSKQFCRISNSDEMLIGIQVGGDSTSGLKGIIREEDTPEKASDKLMPFAMAGNLEAIYILGIIQSYCERDIKNGVAMLKMASSQGYVRASYALGLVLRDSHGDEANRYMKMAADAGYLPALQELLPVREMKAKYGEPNADELRRHLDHLCLSRLLSRHYVRCPDLRSLNTSHCWNPLCGRWAFKATMNPSSRNLRTHPWGTRRDQQSIDIRVSRMKMCSRCCRAKYCSKLCQVYDWRSGRHKMECQFLATTTGA